MPTPVAATPAPKSPEKNFIKKAEEEMKAKAAKKAALKTPSPKKKVLCEVRLSCVIYQLQKTKPIYS